MLLLKPMLYYKQILKKYKNSYMAEDDFKIIIGINCDFIDSNRYSLAELENYLILRASNDKFIAPFAGLFGVMAYDIVHKFEKIGDFKTAPYEFPDFFYADAKAYLHYDKISKIYSFYGDDKELYWQLENLKDINELQDEPLLYMKCEPEDEQESFLSMVQKAKEYIKNGDIFQVVLSKTLKISSNLDSLKFYEQLKANNPSPYMFHFPTPYGDVVGSSPELIMQIKDSEILVAPIAGTRSRGANLEQDMALKSELLGDEKELSEHKMLIDLARNDIGKFAKTGSVSVKNPMHVVMYESVMHIKSEVYGKKPRNVSLFDILSVVFPAGTLSGSPKIRAMEIINELEDTKRGIYGGGIGFWHFNGDIVMAILIRSAIFVPQDGLNSIYIGAGAGIVYDSNAASEYSEICKKRKSCIKAIDELCERIEI